MERHKEEAIRSVEILALTVLAERLEHGEEAGRFSNSPQHDT